MSTFSLFAYNPTDVNTKRLFDPTFTFSLYLKSSYAKIWELSILSLHVIQFILVILHRPDHNMHMKCSNTQVPQKC